MKRRLTALGLVAMGFFPTSAHAAWGVVTGASGKCTTMSFVDDKTGFGVIDTGAAMSLTKTTDGANWTPVTSPTLPLFIQHLLFTKADTGYLVRGSGATTAADSIYKTTDGGATWNAKAITLLPTTSGSSTWLTRVHLGTTTHGVAVGTFGFGQRGFIAVSSDGGETWSEIAPPTNSKSLNNVVVLSPTHFVVVGGGTNPPNTTVLYKIWNTKDGGATWTERHQGSTDGLIRSPLDHVGGTLWAWQGCAGPAAVENKCVLRSTNGGDTWDTTMNQYLDTSFSEMQFADANNGLGVGADIWKTTNGGITWTKQTKPAASGGPYACVAYPGPSAYAGGQNPGGQAWIYDDAQGGGPRPGVGANPAVPDGGAGGDAGSGGGSSGGEPPPAGSSSGGATSSGGAGDTGSSGGGGEDGGCAVGGQRSSSALALALGALGLAALGRRRRRHL